MALFYTNNVFSGYDSFIVGNSVIVIVIILRLGAVVNMSTNE